MKRGRIVLQIGLPLIAAALLVAFVSVPACAQQPVDSAVQVETDYLNRGVVEDWSTRHVVFSNPGTLEDARRCGKEAEWHRIVSDPRYRMQWVKRYGAPYAQATAGQGSVGPERPKTDSTGMNLELRVVDPWRKIPPPDLLQRDWAVQLGSSTASVAIGQYAAKYTFTPIGSPSCTADFVVFPIDKAGQATQQANIIGVNNLYKTTCTGTVPNIKFSYFVGTGIVQTSPVLSQDGTKVAFVETVTNGSIFHVLTLGTTGNNGTAFNSAVAPGAGNNAVDTKITMNGGRTDSDSGPFVDYQNDVAYVGDDTGRVHKFTGVFLGTPAEAGAPWPHRAGTAALTGAVYDSASTNIFVGTAAGTLRCVTSAGANCATASISVASGTTPGAVQDTPVVDSTNGKVYATASNSTNSVVLQVNTSLGAAVRANMGVSGTDLYDGAFDNAYLSSTGGTGNLYFCGNGTSTALPTLLRIAITNGTMSGSHDANSFTLATTAGTASDCTPLTEVLNGTTDYLFLGVRDNGFLPNCNGNTCVMTFVITSSFPSSGPLATLNNLGAAGVSGIIIDNVSSATGASQVYFGSLQNSTGIQASQSGLQ